MPQSDVAFDSNLPLCASCDAVTAIRADVVKTHGSQYVCNLKIQRGAPECQNLRAGTIDAQVAAAFLQAVAAAEIDALSKARKTQLRSERALRQAEEQQLKGSLPSSSRGAPVQSCRPGQS
ncbi:hypothetical protein QCM77_35170 [Bradyrhizobium sp. SSUT18]|uniref:hypothetical protein n=1 Tax=Bradyrhizobium sp. SSUT18 TaxID=3040602 RepID=UPI00244B1182|nr:hypothetical protein [Bradyrhizobium sp. SSUT18]MDH2405111.1 hypothetical protein [Bradyrhizobium sp. SSUT18]